MSHMHVKLKSGACLIQVKPMFSFDCQHVIIACGSEVRSYVIKSGECIQILKYHTTPIINIKENKVNNLQIFSCSEDGQIVRWDYLEGKVLQVYNLNMEIFNFHPFNPSEGLWLITKKFKDQFRLYAVSSNGSKVGNVEMILKPVLPKENTIGYGYMDKYLASIFENNLNIYKFETKSRIRHKYGTRTFTCVSCHPSDYVIATGDCHGRIVLWSNALVTNQPIRSVYHWHSLPVSDLAFSPEGSYLHSGGGEAALVKWNLFSEEKFILPRMGAPILYINASKDNCYIATLHSDNVLQVTDSQRNIVQVIQGLTRSEGQNVGLLYHAHLKALVLSGKPGHLQFYDIKQDKQLFNLDISSKNFLSQEREFTIVNIDVQKAAVDDSGLWLATAEYWCNEDSSPQIWLKFWLFDLEKQTFILNTNIILPHNKSLNCILFKPSLSQTNLAVTTSSDGRFKIWTLNASKDSDKLHWSCDSMGCYRDLPAGKACFSEEGSLLAVAFESVATLWNVEGTDLKAVLCHDKNKRDIKQLLFGQKDCSYYLLCHDSTSLTVWNVLTLSIAWIVHTEVQVLAVDSLSNNIAAFCTNQSLIIFQPNSPKPIHAFEKVSETPITSAVFVPFKDSPVEEKENSKCSQLYFLNKNQNLLTLSEISEEDESSTKKTATSSSVETPFAMLQAVHKKSDVQKIEIEQFSIGKQEEEIFISNPVLQNPLTLCATILPSLLKPLKIEPDEKEAEAKQTDSRENKAPEGLLTSPLQIIDLKNVKPIISDFSFLQQTASFFRSTEVTPS